MQQVSIQYYSSPCGEIILASVDDELCLCDWNEMPCSVRNKLRLSRYMKAEFKIETSPILELAKKQLNEYLPQFGIVQATNPSCLLYFP